jgi:hypothetical protein
MNRLILALALLALLSGCSICERHATACAVAAGVAGTCLALSLGSGHSLGARHDIGLQPVNCTGASCR